LLATTAFSSSEPKTSRSVAAKDIHEGEAMSLAMNWIIVEQVEVYGRNRIPVKCKWLRYFPIEGKHGEVSFGKLKMPLFQVLVRNGSGMELKVKLNAAEPMFPEWTIQHPDRLDYRTITVGEGRRKKTIPDMLSPKATVKGEREKHNHQTIEPRLTRLFGAVLATEIIDLFARKLGRVVQAETEKVPSPGGVQCQLR
jgi:hypothetical protein